MKKIKIISLLLLICLCSCLNKKRDNINTLVNQWIGRKILFPQDMKFTIFCKDTTVGFWPFCEDYSIIVYTDSVDCLDCRLQLGKWKTFIANCESALGKPVPVLFYFSSKHTHEISHILKKDNFSYPICIDKNDSLYILNHFPTDIAYQTFLLDKNNKILAIGNPVHNLKIKELYLKIIQGEKVMPEDQHRPIKTQVYIGQTSFSLGKFDWKQAQKVTFTLKNIGDKPLAIGDVTTSCGCTTVDYPKEPAQPGKELKLTVTYKAAQPEHFSKTISVYCNAGNSPIRLEINGDAN